MFEYLKYCRAPKSLCLARSYWEMAICLRKRPLRKRHMCALANRFKFEDEQSAEFLGLSLRQYRNMREETQLSAIATEMLISLSKLLDIGLQTFDGHVDSFIMWLDTPVGALQQSRPIEIIRSKAGIDIVVELLLRMEHSIPE